MAVLSDREVKELIKSGHFVIEPIFDLDAQVGPCSVDVRLGNKFRVFKHSKHSIIDPFDYHDDVMRESIDEDGFKVIQHRYTDVYHVSDNDAFVIHPGDFVLGSVLERIEVPPDLAVKLEGRSSLGRLGIIIHSTAGWVDPGFKGHLTLEISNIGKIPVKLRPGMRIGQLVIERLASECETPYDKRPSSKYTNDAGATESRLGTDIEFSKKSEKQEAD